LGSVAEKEGGRASEGEEKVNYLRAFLVAEGRGKLKNQEEINRFKYFR